MGKKEEVPTPDELAYYARYKFFSNQVWRCFDKVGEEMPGDDVDPEELLIIPMINRSRKEIEDIIVDLLSEWEEYYQIFQKRDSFEKLLDCIEDANSKIQWGSGKEFLIEGAKFLTSTYDAELFGLGYEILVKLLQEGEKLAILPFIEAHDEKYLMKDFSGEWKSNIVDEKIWNLDLFDEIIDYSDFNVQKALTDHEFEDLINLLKREKKRMPYLTIRFLGQIGDKRAIEPILAACKEEIEKGRFLETFGKGSFGFDIGQALSNLNAFDRFILEITCDIKILESLHIPEIYMDDPFTVEFQEVIRKALTIEERKIEAAKVYMKYLHVFKRSTKEEQTYVKSILNETRNG